MFFKPGPVPQGNSRLVFYAITLCYKENSLALRYDSSGILSPVTDVSEEHISYNFTVKQGVPGGAVG
jgi:hypothetical protein